MKESKYKDYDELPVFLNARMVADLLGVSQSTAYELMHEKASRPCKWGADWWYPGTSSLTG